MDKETEMRDKVTDRLSACPFCGATDCVKILKASELNDEDFDPELDDESYAVNCDAQKGGCGSTGGFSVDVNKAVLKWNNRQAQPSPSPASVQSAEDLAFDVGNLLGIYGDMATSIAMIEADRAAQRQIGREEVAKECPSCHCVVDVYGRGHHSAADCKYLKLKLKNEERYAAVVEAAVSKAWPLLKREYELRHEDTECGGDEIEEGLDILKSRLRKALSDLDAEAPQDAQEKESHP